MVIITKVSLIKKSSIKSFLHFLGWLGYSKELIIELCQKYLDMGFTAFKVKVGQSLEDDIKRLKTVRNVIGWDNKLVSKCN